ncbi:hypothetical protein EVAR_30777_1 [Eumeta japonica]|uniref:Uncharacterized protein n=1 Tax=Eumeta variegata TaxID=151549 RepID=A0A4C1V5W1_EUMVA|nr:hypothetical protein EVAR_30777_1 [Eumeta japonica]
MDLLLRPQNKAAIGLMGLSQGSATCGSRATCGSLDHPSLATRVVTVVIPSEALEYDTRAIVFGCFYVGFDSLSTQDSLASAPVRWL